MTARHRIRHRQRVDWFRVLADLQHLGLSDSEISERLTIPRRTIGGWKVENAEPRHSEGEALLALWREMTGKTRDGYPLQLAGFRRWT